MARSCASRSSCVSLAAGAVLSVWVGGCNATETGPKKVSPSPDAKANAQPATDEPAADEPAADEPKQPPPLSEEDLALIAADPKDLTPEMRRKRAYARRRQIMQNPDSPTARALNDLAKAHQSGELNIERRDGVWFSTPGSKPVGGSPPAGWRPSDDEAKPGETAPAPSDAAAPSDPPTSPDDAPDDAPDGGTPSAK